jgi:hypothetical protein
MLEGMNEPCGHGLHHAGAGEDAGQDCGSHDHADNGNN